MGEMSRNEIIAGLIRRGADRARATMYADTFLEYRQASANIGEHGVIVLHPRTANPIENPYLKIRTNALRTLRSFRGLDADFLW